MLDMHITPGREEEFTAWVGESNKIISQFDGFVSRRLLQGSDGSLRMMVEFESEAQFAAMHKSKEHHAVHQQAASFRDDLPAPILYSVIAG